MDRKELIEALKKSINSHDIDDPLTWEMKIGLLNALQLLEQGHDVDLFRKEDHPSKKPETITSIQWLCWYVRTSKDKQAAKRRIMREAEISRDTLNL
ncbi:MAG TPA: hypothetical protein EYQ42_07210 [Thiotrichaceae bacterium]|jgi:hypothetical protein|nr:hypothetical protein [Thiotrichaceae bacterium]